jgi:ectoine hydroxylase-related dioxygenase (phytanoyl-CoA dioxygenase family)
MTRAQFSFSATQSGWLEDVVGSLAANGVAVIESLLPGEVLNDIRERMYRVRDAIVSDVGAERLTRAGESGVLRLMMKYDPYFFMFLALPEVLSVIDRTVSSTAILHLQNGFILPSVPAPEQRRIFQNTYHQDFPRVLNGYLASINVFFAIDEFTRDNGATWVIPGTHQQPGYRPADEPEAVSVALECPAGSMIVFDSTLWHAAGLNTSGRDRLAINHQFTRSWIKQQIDLVRAIGDTATEAQPPRTQQLLGWYTRVVTSLDEYYRPAEQRLYRAGQG